MTEPTPQEETVDEVEAILPIETPESSLENDAKLFTEEEDDQDETFEWLEWITFRFHSLKKC